ncbi:arginase [Diaminobutyricimonas aerilata]|uniref:Arginase n=1 Tax=Diaminobutyricimonas aerilata TaxID=1162967 RepID=A0A2M9CNB4_9MICO|nr:arginase family protein [Diaminobutyricimonas aerilata]PJJ73372.1 arginase [Diaminobutyricimonas aerilata]
MIALIEVPFNSAGTDSGVARMPAALADRGLHDMLGTVTRHPITVRGAVAERGEHGFLAEHALGAMVDDVRTAVTRAWAESRTPVVIGGDCPVMLGALAAHPLGLVFVDGHEDAWPPSDATSGEAADSELGIALGLVAAPPPLGRLIDPGRVLVLGPRDADELEAAGVPRVGSLVRMHDAEWLARATSDDLADAVRQTAARASGAWWVHIDLDVLSTAALAAVDYPQPGGLDWHELDAVVDAVLSVPGCRGASVVIYNPDLDGGAAAARIAEFVARIGALLEE